MIDRHLSLTSKPASLATNSYSTSSHQASILIETDANLRTLTLNRPQALNALDIEMIQNITSELVKWERSQTANLIILKGVGRAFCAGGDVVSLIKSTQSDDPTKKQMAVSFFRSEYVLDSFIAKMSTPVVCFLDGITMGGGLGLSMHTPFRIASENTRVAMPETAIGLFPDVGASFFLPRLDGELGTYLGLTGISLYGWGAYQAGIASHYVPSSSLDALKSRLSALSPNATHDRINDAINEFSADPVDASSSSRRPWDLRGFKRQAIDHCFCPNTVQDILKRLDAVEDGHLFNEDPSLKTWANETKALLSLRSPTSCKVTLMALRKGKHLSIDECFLMEMRLAAICCDYQIHPDFVTGVQHLLIDKKKTRADWQPKDLQDVDENEIEDKYFKGVGGPKKTSEIIGLDFIETKLEAYQEYPHWNYSLPSEEIIKDFAIGNVKGISGSVALTKDELIELITSKWTDKVGVKEKVLDVLERKTVEKNHQQAHVIKWQY